MENNDSNIKSQQTGGLKLMTVFIAVLALHVVVIGGFTVYHLMSGGSPDADLATTDKSHKAATTADTTSPDSTQGDKNTTTPAAPTEVATIPANTPAPEADAAAPTVTTAPATAPTPAPTPAPAVAFAPKPATAQTPAPALILNTPKPSALAPPAEVVDEGSQTPSGPISAQDASAPAPLDSAPTLSVPVAAGPVHMPPAAMAPPAHTHEQIYVVKITDSYKKIAHAHHVTVAQLKEANHIKTDVLHTGQKLLIPSGKTLVATTTAFDSSSTSQISNESATTTNLAATPSNETASTSHHHLYTIVKGDTLIKIAHKFKTTTSAIMAENSIPNPTRLTVGKKLKIPSEESRSAKNSAPTSTQPRQVQAKENAPSAQLANFIP